MQIIKYGHYYETNIKVNYQNNLFLIMTKFTLILSTDFTKYIESKKRFFVFFRLYATGYK